MVLSTIMFFFIFLYLSIIVDYIIKSRSESFVLSLEIEDRDEVEAATGR
jgi:hypothetical protein